MEICTNKNLNSIERTQEKSGERRFYIDRYNALLQRYLQFSVRTYATGFNVNLDRLKLTVFPNERLL
jgi:hypothetical protein